MGETLRHAREQRGLSLDELSKKTKISPVALRAIEANDIQRLPGGIFLRGFLRSYAREVGLNAEDTVSRYVAQFEPHNGQVGDGVADSNVLEMPIGNPEPPPGDEPARRVPLGLTAVIVVGLGVLAYVTIRDVATTRGTASAPVVTNAVALATTSEPAASADETAVTDAATTGSAATGNEALDAGAETGTAGVQEPSPEVAVADNALVVTIQTTGPCWVSAVVDGRAVIYRLMQANEEETLEGGKDVMLLVGDPATFTFQVNGAAGKSLGAAGEVATVHITNDNYQQFVEAEAPEPSPVPAQ